MALYTETVTGSSAVEVYGGLTKATAYHAGMIGSQYTAWRALAATPDEQKRTLITATRYVDSLEWTGEALGLVGNPAEVTTLAWPRTDVYLSDGETEAGEAYQMSVVEAAVFELAALLAEDSSVLDAPTAGGEPQIASVSGGGASVSWFESGSPTEPTTLPTRVDRLIGRWLAAFTGADGDDGVGSYGVSGNEVSDFAATSDLDRRRPF